jgi:hypothetical protein
MGKKATIKEVEGASTGIYLTYQYDSVELREGRPAGGRVTLPGSAAVVLRIVIFCFVVSIYLIFGVLVLLGLEVVL